MNWKVVMAIIFFIWIVIFFNVQILKISDYELVSNPMTLYSSFLVLFIAIFLQLIYLTLKVEKIIYDKENEKIEK
jgi:uncharacterized membrane protein YjjP (DUF1212 family)